MPVTVKTPGSANVPTWAEFLDLAARVMALEAGQLDQDAALADHEGRITALEVPPDPPDPPPSPVVLLEDFAAPRVNGDGTPLTQIYLGEDPDQADEMFVAVRPQGQMLFTEIRLPKRL